MNGEGQTGQGSTGKGPGQQGASQAQTQQQQPQQRQQPQQPQPQGQRRAPQEGLLKRMVSNSGLRKMMVLGFTLLLLGMLLSQAALFITNYDGKELGRPHDEEYDEDGILTEKEKQDNQAMQNAIQYTGRMITQVGVFFVGLFLAIGGISREDWDPKYRMIMVSMAVLLIVVAYFGFLTVLPISFG